MRPTISIIVPVYNVEKYIHECINSILQQSFTDIEVILVDDGSTDSSGRICDEYALKDERIKVIHKKNGGLSSARNAGIDAAIGEYIGFVDSDDWIDREMYQQLYANMLRYHAQISACRLYMMNIDDDFPDVSNGEEMVFSKTEAMEELISNQKLTFSSCNKLFSRVLFQQLRYREGIILEDMDLSYKLVNNAQKIVYTTKPLYFYRYNNASILRGNFSAKRVDEYHVKKEMYEFYKQQYPQAAVSVYGDLFLTGIRLYAMMSNYNRDLLGQYQFLKKVDKSIVKSLVSKQDLNPKEKIQFAISLLSPALLITIYAAKYRRDAKKIS
jgi:glycosyltransferase involved in cell wall biosynthesis